MAFEPEYYHEWDGGKKSFIFVPFFRLDQNDRERTHFDLRELSWLMATPDWELRVGVRQVFWGVTEALHLVDIINQTDLVENIDTEDNLGQPMVNLALVRDWGTVDVFFLPYFRELTVPGPEGRLRTQPRIDADQAQFESSAKEWHIDTAIRWFHTLGIWDIGLSHFYGTSREPSLLPSFTERGELVLIPRYDLIHQTGLDVQATQGNWLWKLEAIHRSGQGDTFFAMTGGFEYTFVGVFDTALDVGLVAEYQFDERGEDGPSPFQDDIVTGIRLNFNDDQSTEALIALSVDRGSGAKFFNVEASRRIGEHFKLELEARFFEDTPPHDALFSFRHDDYVQLALSYYF